MSGTKRLHPFPPNSWTSMAPWGSCKKRKSGSKWNRPIIIQSSLVWFYCSASSVVDLLTALGKTTLTAEFQSPELKVALWGALGSGVSLFCSCWGSSSGGKDSRSSLRWHPRQKQVLCLRPRCTQTNAPAIKMNFSLIWWSVVTVVTWLISTCSWRRTCNPRAARCSKRLFLIAILKQ